ncbi:hypothetical protein Btus_2243 [Kyrpidia tusciae DSM 2912]|uniref:Uncharacterized protein n=1 Tax=Kyrpidia tusciae (strain DSM 2912 / NBRC 15312 / T2) TaxID=562970 RepID=D5WRW3_KYRT2|nr:hypothetical protein Btus_2243 [Kyrpidia tusciae DSM 2912]
MRESHKSLRKGARPPFLCARHGRCLLAALKRVEQNKGAPGKDGYRAINGLPYRAAIIADLHNKFLPEPSPRT